MLCDVCKKNEATIHIKEVHDGKVTASNLCAACAAAKEKQGEFGALGFNLAEVLFSLGKMAEKSLAEGIAAKPAAAEAEEVVCPQCGWTFSKVRHSGGRLGCPGCYHAFEAPISEALGRIQRGPVHLGKRPGQAAESRSALMFELEQRKRELDEMVRREEYEAAAVCRDRINQLKVQLEQSGSSESPEAEEQP